MSLYCNDGSPAEIPPHVELPALARGEKRAPDPERDRCQRPECRWPAWKHWTVKP